MKESPCQRIRWSILMACMLGWMAGCANPMPPTGGPVDEVPPSIRTVVPAEGATMVTDDALIIEFDEYVDEPSFARAFSITPEFAQPVAISWRRRTATIRFPEPLRPNTTYIVQLDANLRDAHGVGLRQPIVLAFSTGAQIDQGVLSGRVVEPARGEPVAGIDVYAYAEIRPDALETLPASPDYRTQTGTDGTFRFRYLPEGVPFYVVAIDDANRNRAPEPMEAVAVPPAASIEADTTTVPSADWLWITHVRDTVPPEPQRAMMVTSRRLTLRFSEPVQFTDWQPWELRDASGEPATSGIPYILDSLSRDVHVVIDSLASGTYEVGVLGLADSTGNEVASHWLPVTMQPVDDTLRVHFSGYWPDDSVATLLPGDSPQIAFNVGLPAERVEALVSVVDASGARLPFELRPRTGARWEVVVPSAWEEGQPIELEVADPRPAEDTIYVRRFRRLPVDETGEITGVVLPPEGPIVVELSSATFDRTWRVAADADGRFMARLLPEGHYALRAFADRDRSGDWSGGALAPYQPPERLTWLADSVRVRARWETALEDTLRLAPAPAHDP